MSATPATTTSQQRCDGGSNDCCVYSVDVLSDGSESTGPPTLFLSVYKTSKSQGSADQQQLSVKDDSMLKARYAISALGDNLCRAAADQRFKLHPVTAVFCAGSSSFTSSSLLQLQGLPSLLQVLHQAGRPALTVAVSDNVVERVERIVHTQLQYKQHPVVRICSVPVLGGDETRTAELTESPETSTLTPNADATVVWWNVYEDDHVQVHASSAAQATYDPTSIVYLYTLKRLLSLGSSSISSSSRTSNNCESCHSILVVPPGLSSSPSLLKQWTRRLPVIPSSSSSLDERPFEIFLGILLDRVSRKNDDDSALGDYPTGIRWYDVRSNCSCRTDPGLLVRAQQQSRAWNAVLPRYFPWNHCEPATDGKRHDHVAASSRRLESGTTLTVVAQDKQQGNTASCGIKLSVVNRLNDLISNEAMMIKSPERCQWPEELREFLSCGSDDATVTKVDNDENEIDLDGVEDDDKSEQEFVSAPVAASAHAYADNGGAVVPQPPEPVFAPVGVERANSAQSTARLLVLGTGGASPSPYRGASGYALLLPGDDLVAVAFEVGEGFVTQWGRYANGRPISMIRLIWISHAHWDHYGGLVNLLTRLKEERRNASSTTDQKSPKRSRTEQDTPPHVVAPRKVLRFLNLYFSEPLAYFRGSDHENSSRTSLVCRALMQPSSCFQPVVFWEDVPVDHSCREAHGFVMGWRNTFGELRIMSFSGDTRPCRRFVDACRRLMTHYGRNQIDFLLHEATFDQEEREMSLAKKHSTVHEALQIARETNAYRTLLTHFSQRYDSVPDIDPKAKKRIGFALDGMLVTL